MSNDLELSDLGHIADRRSFTDRPFVLSFRRFLTLVALVFRKILLALSIVTVFFAQELRANPLDTFGLTSANIAMGGGATGTADSYDAVWYNPAGLGQLDGFDFGLGTLIYRPFLKATTHYTDESDQRIEQTLPRAAVTRGFLDVGLASPIPLGKYDRSLFWGVNITFPIGSIYAIRERPATEAYFPFLEDRNRRIVLNAALAFRWNWLMIGAGLSMLPNVYGGVDVDFTKDAQANQATVDVKMNLAPVVGIMVEPIEGLTIGFNWRCANNTYISIPVTAILSQKIEPVRLKVAAYDYSTPHQIALGAGYKGDNYRVSGDITYSFYKSFNLSTPEVTLFDAGGGDKVVQQILPPSAGFKNTFAVRFGGEYSPLKALAIRAGFGWVQSPVPAQTGVTNLLDGDRFTGSFGLGFDAAGVGGPPIAIDFHLAYGWILENRDAKTAVNLDNPGYPYVSGKGGVLNSGLTFKVRF